MNLSHNNAPIWLDFEELSTEAVILLPEQIDAAVQLSCLIPNQSRQWQTYLNALALFGFEEWLGEQAADLTINREHCTLFQPFTANAIDAVCHLVVNQFKLCLIVVNSLTDPTVILPRAVVDLPEFMANFYLLVEVQEEQEMATILSFISEQELMNKRVIMNLQAESDWTYEIPRNWFESDVDRLLLHLRCLHPRAMPLPPIPNRRNDLGKIQQELSSLLPQLQFPELEIWQILNWEQGTVVLTNHELLKWVYELQIKTEENRLIDPGENLRSLSSLQQHLPDLIKLLTQPAVNVGRWLWGELDELAQELSWVLLPSLSPATALRSPREEFEAIITELQRNGLDIPGSAGGAYRDVLLAQIPLRLYGVTWPLLSDAETGNLASTKTCTEEWTLLLILGATFGNSLPAGVKLRVSDRTGILFESVVDADDNYPYFFTRVIGTWDEKFIVTVGLNSGIEQTLPPFGFQPEGCLQ